MMATFEGLAGLQDFSIPPGAYSKLSPNQLERAARSGIQKAYVSTTDLYHQGERGADFYIILAGAIQTFWSDPFSGKEYFLTLEPGEFSGELNLLNERETLISARALAGSSVLKVPRGRLRKFLIAEPEISEIIVRAIVHRRQFLVQLGAGGLALVADGESGDAGKLARFLTANMYPFRLIDLHETP